MGGNGLEERIGPVVGASQQMRVRPNLGVEGAAAGVKNPDNFPVHGAEANGVAQRQAGVRGICVLAHYDFSKAGREHASLDDLDLLTDLQDVRRDAADFNVCVRACRAQRDGRHKDGFRSHQRTVGPARNAGSILNDLDGIEPDATGHFGSRARAEDQRIVG